MQTILAPQQLLCGVEQFPLDMVILGLDTSRLQLAANAFTGQNVSSVLGKIEASP